MNTIFSRLIFLLFLLIPLVFVGTDSPTILAPFVMPGYHYESIKVLVFFILGIFLCIISLLSWGKKDTTHHLSHAAILGFLFLITSIILSTVFSDFPTEALGGSFERRHGTILYGSLVLIYFLLQQRMSPEIQTMGERGIFTGFILLSGYALIQACGFGITLPNNDIMISSTLGNSAYLAGYTLILLPWILQEGRSRLFQYILGILAIIIILATKSFSAIILTTLYFIYIGYIGFKEYTKSRTAEKTIKPGYYFLLLLLLTILLGGTVFFSLTHFPLGMKVQNFETRTILWHETLSVWKRDSISIVFGNGADTLGNFFELERRSNTLRKYIPDIYSIDRAHNIFLDILFSFGIMGLLTFLIPVWALLRNRLHHPGAHVILLFFAFFSFNIPVISHWIIFIFALATIKRKE